jgi:hypothetical protein
LTQSDPVATANGWYEITYTGAIPAGQNVIGIHLTGGAADSAANQQIGAVRLTN